MRQRVTSTFVALLLAFGANCSAQEADAPVQVLTEPGHLAMAAGQSATLKIRLAADPGRDVTAHIEIATGADVFTLATKAKLAFGSGDWSKERKVTVRAAKASVAGENEGRLRIVVAGAAFRRSVPLVRKVAADAEPTTPVADWTEGKRQGPLGATREHFNGAASLRWRNRLGDYRDARGKPQGPADFAMTRIEKNGEAQFIEWDVRDLVRAWVAGQYPNRGFFIKGIAGSGKFRFLSRENKDEKHRPQLVVKAGGKTVLAPVADTHLDGSTYKSLGDAEALRLSDEVSMLMRFDLSPLMGKKVSSATLRLYKDKGWGSGLQAAIFRCSPGVAEAPSAPTYGIAERYPGDAGIGADPDVYMASGFESDDWASAWSKGADAGNLSVTARESKDDAFAPLQGRALRVLARKGKNTFLNMYYLFGEKAGAEPEEAYLRYYIRFGTNWAPSEGGKLP
ncbi:MAG: DNRLRE domain-containing protein, partial [Planctomycetota bacterium]